MAIPIYIQKSIIMKKSVKFLFYSFILVFMPFLTSCTEEAGPSEPEFGNMVVKFDNYVGDQLLQLDAAGSSNFRYTSTSGQPFNVTLFGYYISHVKLEGPNGAVFIDPMKASANAAEIKGYYRVVQGEPDTYKIKLENIPAGEYDKISFTVGVRADGIQEGAVGGILDPAAGGWFWNWNSGFIHMAFEGQAPSSPIDGKKVQIHVGGWKDIPSADPTQPQRFFDNNVTVTLPFDAVLKVGSKLEPSPHIHVDVLEFLGNVDFGVSNNVHSPSGGKPFAARIKDSFILDHTHQ
jgi:hypothetical protein